jgi:hypothetical protein
MTTSAAASKTRGLLRVAPWSFGYGVFGALVFAREFTQGKPNWLILGGITLLWLVGYGNKIRKLITLTPGNSNEKLTVVLGATGAMLVAAFILIVTYRFNAAYAVHLLGLYFFSSTAVVATVIGFAALLMERKAKVRVYMGNIGWVYVSGQPPSNSTLHRTRA